MGTLIVGAKELKKGIEYSGLVPHGNAFRLTEKVRISINRSPFTFIPVHENIITVASFTYSLEEDTTILLTRVVTSGLNVTYLNECYNDQFIPKNTLSDEVCTLTTVEAFTTGRLYVTAQVENMDGQEAQVDVMTYKNGTLLSTTPTRIQKRQRASVSQEVPLTASIVGDVYSFKIEANRDLNVYTNQSSSKVQVELLT